MNNKINFKDFLILCLICYGVFFSGIIAYKYGKEIIIDQNGVYEIASTQSGMAGIFLLVIGIIVSWKDEKLYLPVVMSYLFIFFTIIVFPFSYGHMCLHHGSEFDIGAFLLNGNFGMLGLIILTILSWINYFKNKSKKSA